MTKAESYLKRVDKLIKQIEKKEVKKELRELHEKTIEDITAALKMVGVKATSGNEINCYRHLK